MRVIWSTAGVSSPWWGWAYFRTLIAALTDLFNIITTLYVTCVPFACLSIGQCVKYIGISSTVHCPMVTKPCCTHVNEQPISIDKFLPIALPNNTTCCVTFGICQISISYSLSSRSGNQVTWTLALLILPISFTFEPFSHSSDQLKPRSLLHYTLRLLLLRSWGLQAVIIPCSSYFRSNNG